MVCFIALKFFFLVRIDMLTFHNTNNMILWKVEEHTHIQRTIIIFHDRITLHTMLSTMNSQSKKMKLARCVKSEHFHPETWVKVYLLIVFSGLFEKKNAFSLWFSIIFNKIIVLLSSEPRMVQFCQTKRARNLFCFSLLTASRNKGSRKILLQDIENSRNVPCANPCK